MPRSGRMPRCIALIACTVVGPLTAADPAPDKAGLAFFEQKIRPVLVEKCYSCHSLESKKGPKGGLRVDSRDALLAGGDSGPAVVPGKTTESVLLKALRGDDLAEMPPSGKLPDGVIADFEKWVAMGAPDPRAGAVVAPKQVGLSVEAGRAFWAYKPPVAAAVPAVKDASWPVNEIDRFVLSKIEAAGFRPAPEADRATLARRVSFDLTGLPMPVEEVDAFVRDTDPAAFEKLVDRLIASPAFGERWGRHWLDVARYAESLTLRGFLLKPAWRYRDYVIDSFNRDVPFDRFVKEQIAGDLLPAATPEDRRRQTVATSFLVMGNTNLEEQDKKQLRMDVVDEMLDVISKGFLAQTVTCARCHDHKFDPIPQADYYALAGILRNARAMTHANVSSMIEVPLPVPPDEETALKAHEQKVAELKAKIAAAKPKGKKPSTPPAGIVVDGPAAKQIGRWKTVAEKGYVGPGYLDDGGEGKGEKTLTYDPEIPETGKYEARISYSRGPDRSNAVPVTVFSADGEKTVTVDMTVEPTVEGRFVALGVFRFEKGGQSFAIVSNEGTRGRVTPDAMAFVLVESEAAPAEKPEKPSDAVAAMEAELKKQEKSGPERPKALSVVEEKAIEDARIHVRGSPHTLGPAVPRGFLKVATTGPMPKLPADRSGREELAEWIASADNPLTARVFVNRVWHWLFGAGIVRTPDNFGTTGDSPTHPELLDWLAVRFAREGWSVKRLVREIVLSRTYRQSATGDPATASGDLENKLFARANRRRLDVECLRDAMLAVSGKLDATRGGQTYPPTQAADYGYVATGNRRSVYLPAFRNSMPPGFDAFDAADTSFVTGRRSVSTVAPQALFMLNNPLVAEQAKHAAARLLADGSLTTADRVERAYRMALGRVPTDGERRVAERFLAGHMADQADAVAGLFHALFASADFRYVD